MKIPKHDISNVFIYISRSNEKKLKYTEGELTVSTPYSFDKMYIHRSLPYMCNSFRAD